MNQLDAETRQKWKELLEWFRKYNRIGVALSGGVDSAVACAAAVHALGVEHVKVFTIQSPMEHEREIVDSANIASFLGLKQEIIQLNELMDPNIQSNPIDRCYFCKLLRMQEMKKVAEKYKLDTLIDGSNADDLLDYRPGRKALKEQGVLSPLAETGISKEMVRRIAEWQGLFVWDKPSTACLASRFPYGETLNIERINQVACAEQFLIGLGLITVRVRYHQDVARLELPIEDFKILLANKERVVEKLKQCGFKYIALDLQGFRSGSLNEGIK